MDVVWNIDLLSVITIFTKEYCRRFVIFGNKPKNGLSEQTACPVMPSIALGRGTSVFACWFRPPVTPSQLCQQCRFNVNRLVGRSLQPLISLSDPSKNSPHLTTGPRGGPGRGLSRLFSFTLFALPSIEPDTNGRYLDWSKRDLFHAAVKDVDFALLLLLWAFRVAIHWCRTLMCINGALFCSPSKVN